MDLSWAHLANTLALQDTVEAWIVANMLPQWPRIVSRVRVGSSFVSNHQVQGLKLIVLS